MMSKHELMPSRTSSVSIRSPERSCTGLALLRKQREAVALMDDLHINDKLVVPARLMSFSAARSGGAGGQHVNKVATKVDLRVDFEKLEGLSDRCKARLRHLARGRIDRTGRLVISCGTSRSQSANLEEAKKRAAMLIERALEKRRKRKPTKPSKGWHKRRVADKRKRGETKASRKKVNW